MKRLVVELNEKLHQDIKIKAVNAGKTIKEFITELLTKINKKNEKST